MAKLTSEIIIFVAIFGSIDLPRPAWAAQQCLTVRGRVRCGMGPAPDVASPIYLKLIDEDSGRPDDQMDQTYAGKDSGAFQMRGCASDNIGDIDPEMHVYHKCKGKPLRVKFVIPAEAINREHNFTEVINLQANFGTEQDYAYPVPKCPQMTNTTQKKPK